MKTPVGIYIHIPYCTSKCVYCDFVSCAVSQAVIEPKVYIETLIKEIKHQKQDILIESIFFGGGTPSAISETLIVEVLKTLSKGFEWSKAIEITIECNPETLDESKLKAYREAGVNRLSIGLQTTDDGLLKVIGRQHTFERFLEAFALAKLVGFHNINVDLMFGLPGQRLEDLIETIKKVVALKPTHIASYGLKMEENTPLFERYEKGTFVPMDEDKEREMYHELVARLKAFGYNQYELSNFAIKGFESRHNLIYWENKPYIGLGAAAHSKFNGLRYSNTEDLVQYVSLVGATGSAVCGSEVIDAEEDLFETIILGLRLNKGIDTDAINAKYGIDFFKKYDAIIASQVEKGLILVHEKTIILTDLGRDLSNVVFVDFL